MCCILFLIGLWLIPCILCLVLIYFIWREERGNDKTVSALFEYCSDLVEEMYYWPIFIIPVFNMLMVIMFTLKYLYLLFKDKELW